MEHWQRASFSTVPEQNGTQSQVGAGVRGDFNRTRSIVEDLVLNNVRAVRYQHIGLGAFSIALATIIAARIWYDSWRASQLTAKLRPRYDVLSLRGKTGITDRI